MFELFIKKTGVFFVSFTEKVKLFFKYRDCFTLLIMFLNTSFLFQEYFMFSD